MSSEEKAAKGPKKRDPACLEVISGITIPAGTILRQEPGKAGTFSCLVEGGKFTIDAEPALIRTGYRRVIA